MKASFVPVLLVLILVFPATSGAFVTSGVGWGLTAFEDDLDGINTAPGFSAEIAFGSGSLGVLISGQVSKNNDESDYTTYMMGPVWSPGVSPGYKPRIYAGISGHNLDSSNPAFCVDGWGLTLGGGVDWKIMSKASLGLDVRISQWEGENGLAEEISARTGILQLLFRLGY